MISSESIQCTADGSVVISTTKMGDRGVERIRNEIGMVYNIMDMYSFSS